MKKADKNKKYTTTTAMCKEVKWGNKVMTVKEFEKQFKLRVLALGYERNRKKLKKMKIRSGYKITVLLNNDKDSIQKFI